MRLVLIPPILLSLSSGWRIVSLILFGLALASDVIDGSIARGRHEITQLGQLLDPFVDKTLFLSIFAYFTYVGFISPYILGALIVPYLSLIIGGFIMYHNYDEVIQARFWGKTSSAILALGLLLVFFQTPYYRIVIYTGVALAYISATVYFILAARINLN